MSSTEQALQQPAPGESSSWLKNLIGIPLWLLGGLVTFCFGVVLCIYVFHRVVGGRPVPGLGWLLVPWLLLGIGPLGCGFLLLRVAQTRKQFWWRLFFGMLLLFLVVGADGAFGPKNWQRAFRREQFPGSDAASLKNTIVSPHLEATISPGTNVLWCGTFQLAWNEACALTGGDLRFDQTHPMIAALNKHTFTKESIDESSYVALAGLVKDRIHEKIQRTVKEKFRGSFKPRLVPEKGLTPRPQDLVAYACLYKNLSFPVPFERLEEPLRFSGASAVAFGMGLYKPSLEKIYPQVLILDYQGEDDFVIEFKTKDEGDRLILAKLQPKATLGDTVASVQERTEHGNSQPVLTNDVLSVPRIAFDLTRRYSEIEGLRLIPQSTTVATDLVLCSAVQNTRFEMNEKGVELQSEAHMAFGCAKQETPVRQHSMIFDKPFLVMMQRKNAKVPFFALWIDNPELLITLKE